MSIIENTKEIAELVNKEETKKRGLVLQSSIGKNRVRSCDAASLQPHTRRQSQSQLKAPPV